VRNTKFVASLLGAFLLLAATSANALPHPKHIGEDGESGCPNNAECGTIIRPLDPEHGIGGKISIAYRLYRHRGPGAAVGTILAQEGGPGLPSIRSHGGYLYLFATLRADHDILMVDARGTGESGAIDCPSVQRHSVRTPEDVGECGRSLGRAADYYGTRLAAEDMKAVLDKLKITTIDYYGDSYGTFFGQVFSALYPGMLRSVVLDGAYPVIGESPWYPHAGEVIRRGFNLACERTAYCAGLKGSSLGRINKLMDYVRAHPITGRAPDGDGQLRDVVVDPSSMGLLFYDGDQGPVNYRDLDAATRAYFDNNDALPLLRLVAENNANEDTTPVKGYSYGLFAATSCIDYQQIYDMQSPLARRVQQRDEAVAKEQEKRPDLYSPLTIAEFQTVPIDIGILNLCIDWPTRNPPYQPGLPIPDGATFTEAPTLVINGELDMLTTAAEGAIVTKQYPHGQQVVIANSFHVDAIYDVDDCTQAIVRRFVKTLSAGDTSCAANVKPVRLVPIFVRHAADAIPAVPSGGNTATTLDLSMASTAVQTAGDAMQRWNINYSGHGVGLRGGKWHYNQPDQVARYTLSKTLWTEDLPVSGRLIWDQRNGVVRATLEYTDPAGNDGHVTVTWNDRDYQAVATLTGTVAGRVIQATMPAP
jgi:pimeloyl-ACP methyl ester carboxylesterase